MNKILVSKSLSILVLPLLIVCGGSSEPTSSVVSESDLHHPQNKQQVIRHVIYI